MGQMANEVRAAIEEKLAARGAALKAAMAEQKLKMETIDVTLPGKPVREGHRHPLNLVLDEIKEIFLGMGFDVVSGPEVELDYYVCIVIDSRSAGVHFDLARLIRNKFFAFV